GALHGPINRAGKPARRREEEVILLLTHHPRSWLCESSNRRLDEQMWGKRVVHLCGHVHREGGGVHREMGADQGVATLVAGAVYDADDGQQGYSWGELRREPSSGQWHLGWAPRTSTIRGFVPDRTNYSLDNNGYC